MDHTTRTIETYDQIAIDYHVIATPEHRAWLEDSMREFHSRLPGKTVLVAGCGEGRDSRYLQTLGARVISFDLSEGMLALARASDPAGEYLHLDLRHAQTIKEKFDGVWACACLYHLTKQEFRQCLRDFHSMLNPDGVLFLNLKLGVSMLFGFPMLWLVGVLCQMLVGGGSSHGLQTWWQKLYAVTVQAPWLIPYESEMIFIHLRRD